MECLYAQGYGKQQARQNLKQLWIPRAAYQKLPTNSQSNCPRPQPQIQKKQMWVPKKLLQAQGYTNSPIKVWLPKTNQKPTLPNSTRILNPQTTIPDKPKGKLQWVPKVFSNNPQQKQSSSHTRTKTNHESPKASLNTTKWIPILTSTNKRWIPKKQDKHPAVILGRMEQALR